MEKARSFWLHYNKPESKKRGRNVLTVHVNKQCLLVESIDCKVPLRSKDRKAQPRCVLTGRGVVRVIDGVAVITHE